jgi:hypothetical protein
MRFTTPSTMDNIVARTAHAEWGVRSQAQALPLQRSRRPYEEAGIRVRLFEEVVMECIATFALLSPILDGDEESAAGVPGPDIDPSAITPDKVPVAVDLKLCCTFLLKVLRTLLSGQAPAPSRPDKGCGSSDCVMNVEWMEESDKPLHRRLRWSKGESALPTSSGPCESRESITASTFCDMRATFSGICHC